MKKCLSHFLLILLIITRPTKAQFQIQQIDSCMINAVGDIMVHDSQLISALDKKTQTYDFTPSFKYIKKHLSLADLTIGNLETTLPGNDYSGYPRFGAPDALGQALKDAGFDLLSTANNHACDKGKPGLIRTLYVLDTLQIAHCGTYRNKKEHQDNRVLVINCNDIKISFVNYTYSTNGLRVPKSVVVNQIDSSQMIQDMAQARAAQTDFICVLLHFGPEYRRTPDDSQKDWINFFLDEGADIVLGSHPHVVQPFTLTRRKDNYGKIKSRLVIYSLGNFISNQKRPYTDSGIIFSFKLKKTTMDNDRTYTTIDKIHYTPLMVYEEKKPANHAHYVLPVEDIINKKTDLKLPQTVHRKLIETKAYYKNHLKSSLEQTQKFVQSRQRGRTSGAIF
ncbi:CapA family protein [bacterium]